MKTDSFVRRRGLEVSSHGPDWCHLCGFREDKLADCWYPRPEKKGGAEHNPTDKSAYIRICATCADTIAKVARCQVPT